MVLAGVVFTASARGADDAAPPPERLSLWTGAAPVGDGKGSTETTTVNITVHRPAADKNAGTAIVICPGGGYGRHVVEAEGHGIARWLVSHGITGVVLEYRLPAGRPFVPLLDAQRAIRTVRAKAADWNIIPNRIGIMGFSAGGHLAATAATHFDTGNTATDDRIEQLSSRPDFAILVYPVISMGALAHTGSKANLLGTNPTPELIDLFSNEKQVTAQTPPIFMAHAKDDKPVPPEHSRLLYAALQQHKVPAEYLELPEGGHGLNGYKGPQWDRWQARSLEWLAERGLLAAAETERMVFEDRFTGKLGEGWTWVHEDLANWQIEAGKLQIRSTGGSSWRKSANGRNYLLRPVPEEAANLAVEVYLENRPTSPYEHAGLWW